MHGTAIETLRETFRPTSVRVLLVGESPPASGGFFYRGGAMTIFTARAFEQAFGITFRSTDHFLAYFRDSGCFLEDISHLPVDALAPRDRIRAIESCVPQFGHRLRELHPEVVVGVLQKIESPLRDAVGRSGLAVPLHVLPFPVAGTRSGSSTVSTGS